MPNENNNNNSNNNNNNNNNSNDNYIASRVRIVIHQAHLEALSKWEPSAPSSNEETKKFLLNFLGNINTLEVKQVLSDVDRLSELIKENMTAEDRIKIYPTLIVILQTIARSLYDNDIVSSKDIFIYSNNLIDELLKLTDPSININRLGVIKKLNDTYLFKFKEMERFSKVRAIPSDPKTFSALVTQELVNNMLRFKYKFEHQDNMRDSLKNVITHDIQISQDQRTKEISDIAIVGIKFRNLKLDHLADFLKKCNILYKLLVITEASDENAAQDNTLIELPHKLYVVVSYWLRNPLKSIDFAKQEPLIIDLLDILCDTEIKVLSLLPKDRRASFLISGIMLHNYYFRTFFYEATRERFEIKVPEIREKIKKKLINLKTYLDQVQLLYPEIELSIDTLRLYNLLEDLALAYVPDLYNKMHEPQQQISFLFKVLATFDREQNNETAKELLMNAMVELGVYMVKFDQNIIIFKNFDEIDTANFIKLLSRTKEILTKMYKDKVDKDYKRDVYFGIFYFWENAIKQALKCNRYDLLFTATLFIKKEFADHKILNVNFDFDEFIDAISENLNSCISQVLENENQEMKNFIISNIGFLVDYLIKADTLEKAEKKVSLNRVLKSIVNALPLFARYNLEIPLSKSLIPLVIHSPHLIQKEHIVLLRISYLKQFCSQPIADDRIKEVNTFADICADYYFAQLAGYTNNNVSNNNNNNNEQQIVSEDYLPVLCQIYKNLAASYDKKHNLVMKLDCYNMLQEIDPNNSLEYKKESNTSMQLMIKIDIKLTDKIIFLEDIIVNCTELHDSEGLQKAQKMLYDVKLQLVEHYIDKRKFRYAHKICDELINACKNENIEEIKALKEKVTSIEEEAKIKQGNNNNIFSYNHDTHTKPKKKATVKNTKQQTRTKKPDRVDALGNEQKQVSSRVEESTRPVYIGGKVGERFEATYMSSQGAANFFPVVLKDIPGFDHLKQTNYVLYRRLKRAALYKGACREFGVAGVKYLGKYQGKDYWEAKVPRTKERLIGHTVEKDGVKMILFDTYSSKGLHKG